MRELELIKAGFDSQGDEFTQGALEGIVEVFNRFKVSVPITMGFGPEAKLVGKITGLRMEGDCVIAACDLDENGEEAVGSGMELAAGGTSITPNMLDGPVIEQKAKVSRPMKIEQMILDRAALTDKKVK